MARALFILKRREDYGTDPSYSGSYQIATGMWNSALFCSTVLQDAGTTSMVEMVVDANGIDAVVTNHNPDVVFIEGLWVTPAKFDELLAIPRHQPRRWVVRVHSEIPFLATESIAMDWVAQYLQRGVIVAPNAPRAQAQLRYLGAQLSSLPLPVDELVPLLPNCYPTTFDPLSGLDTSAKPHLDVACFGAFRPLKNQLQQVFVAARFAEQLGKPLRFHTNLKTDAGGVGILRNVEGALEALGATHVQHPWEDRSTFLQSLRDCDLLLQLSMSETFNIVAADCTLVGRPMLVSDEISWAYPLYGDPHRVDDCVQKLTFIWAKKEFFINKNRRRLKATAERAATIWRSYV